MKFIILYLLFFMAGASAKEPNLKILKILNSDFSPFEINQCSIQTTLNPNREEQLQECALALCGKPSETVSGTLNDRTFQDYVKPGTMERFSEVESELKDIIKSQNEKNSKFLKILKEKLTKGKLELNFKEWKSEDYGDFLDNVFSQHIETNIDTKLELGQRVTVKPIYPKDASITFRKALDSYAKSKLNIIKTNVKEGLYEGLYKDEEFPSLINTLWETFFKKYQAALKTNPEFMKDQQEGIKELESKIGKTYTDSFGVANLLSLIEFQETNYYYAQNGTYPTTTSPNYCEEKDCQEGVKEFLVAQNMPEMIAKLEKANDLEPMIKNHLILCKSTLASKNLADSDKEDFLKLIPDIKERILQRATQNFSSHSLEALKLYLDTLHFSFKKKVEADASDNFIKDIHEKHKEIKDGWPEEFVETPKELMKKMLNYQAEFSTTINPMPDSYLCLPELQSTVRDAFAPKNLATKLGGADIDPSVDNISISPFACAHHVSGKAVVAHEFGHALSFAFFEKKLSEHSFEEYKKLRACANSHSKNLSDFKPSPVLNHPGDTYRTEEDTADLIAYLAYPEEEKLFLCALLETDIEETLYTNLGLENSMKQDPHSAPLLRLLLEAIHKKKAIPVSCRPIMDFQTDYGFNSCF